MKFQGSAAKKGQFIRDGLPQVVICGKSNVGKSSLINSLGNNGKLARTSAAPGKTRLVNYFLAEKRFYIVDLPGYGFAKAPKVEQEQWQKLMDAYFSSGTAGWAIHLVDIRHKPTREDLLMRQYLQYFRLSILTVATKADKIAKSKVNHYTEALKKELGMQEKEEILPYSSENGLNRDRLILTIRSIAHESSL